MPKRHRYANRSELAELIAPHLSALDEKPDWSGADAARLVLDVLAELGAPVDQLVRITVDDPLTPEFDGG